MRLLTYVIEFQTKGVHSDAVEKLYKAFEDFFERGGAEQLKNNKEVSPDRRFFLHCINGKLIILARYYIHVYTGVDDADTDNDFVELTQRDIIRMIPQLALFAEALEAEATEQVSE